MLIVDKGRRDIGSALLEIARDLGADPIVHEIESHGDRPIRQLPDSIRDGARPRASQLARHRLRRRRDRYASRAARRRANAGAPPRAHDRHLASLAHRRLLGRSLAHPGDDARGAHEAATRLAPSPANACGIGPRSAARSVVAMGGARGRDPPGQVGEPPVGKARRRARRSCAASSWPTRASGSHFGQAAGLLEQDAGADRDRKQHVQERALSGSRAAARGRVVPRARAQPVARRRRRAWGPTSGSCRRPETSSPTRTSPAFTSSSDRAIPEQTGASWSTRGQLPMTASLADVDLDGAPLLRAGRYMVT